MNEYSLAKVQSYIYYETCIYCLDYHAHEYEYISVRCNDNQQRV